MNISEIRYHWRGSSHEFLWHENSFQCSDWNSSYEHNDNLRVCMKTHRVSNLHFGTVLLVILANSWLRAILTFKILLSTHTPVDRLTTFSYRKYLPLKSRVLQNWSSVSLNLWFMILAIIFMTKSVNPIILKYFLYWIDLSWCLTMNCFQQLKISFSSHTPPIWHTYDTKTPPHQLYSKERYGKVG